MAFLKSSEILTGIHSHRSWDNYETLPDKEVKPPKKLVDYLSGFKGINIDLEKGFNRLDFEALNQGSSGPNTAQVNVYDDKGALIHSNQWLLSTGSKASLIVVKQ